VIALKLILEGLGLGFLLYLSCAIGIRNGAIGMIHLYDPKVQERVVQLGLTTAEEIRKRSVRFRSLCLPVFQHYIPETKGCDGYHIFGYNRKEQFWRIVTQPFAALLTAWVCTLMKELGLSHLVPAMCRLDYTMSEAGGATEFVREYTLASGGPYCDCGYKKLNHT